MEKERKGVAYYHLPGLFEFYEFYKVFLEVFRKNREFFYEWCRGADWIFVFGGTIEKNSRACENWHGVSCA